MQASRRTATFVWAAMLVVPVAFLAVSSTVSAEHAAPGFAGLLLALAAIVSVVNVALARILPARLGPARAHDRDAAAFGRVVLSLALCEAAALAPVVAYMIARDPRLLAVLVADGVALVALYPSDRRWAALRPPGDEGAVAAPATDAAREEAP